MKRLFDKLPARKATLWLDDFINRNNGWLIATAIVFFGILNFNQAKTNEQLLLNTKRVAETAQRNSDDLKRLLCKDGIDQQECDIVQAVLDLKADNEQQTRILCRLILSNGVTLTGVEADEIEGICQEAIDRGSDPRPKNSSTSPNINQEGLEPMNEPESKSNPNPNNQRNVPQSPQTEKPSIFERAIDGVSGIIETITN